MIYPPTKVALFQSWKLHLEHWWMCPSGNPTVIIPFVSSSYPSWFITSIIKSKLEAMPSNHPSYPALASSVAWAKEYQVEHGTSDQTTALETHICTFPRDWTYSLALVQAKSWLTSWTKHLEVNWEITIAAINPSVKRWATIYPAFIFLWLTPVNSTNTSMDTKARPNSSLIAAPSPYSLLRLERSLGRHSAARILSSEKDSGIEAQHQADGWGPSFICFSN